MGPPPLESLPLVVGSATNAIEDLFSRVSTPIIAAIGAAASGYAFFKYLKFVETIPEGYAAARTFNGKLFKRDGRPIGVFGPGKHLHLPLGFGGFQRIQCTQQADDLRPSMLVQRAEKWTGDVTVGWGVDFDPREKHNPKAANGKFKRKRQDDRAANVCRALKASTAGSGVLQRIVLDLTCGPILGDELAALTDEEFLDINTRKETVQNKVIPQVNNKIKEAGLVVSEIAIRNLVIVDAEIQKAGTVKGANIVANAISPSGALENGHDPTNGIAGAAFNTMTGNQA